MKLDTPEQELSGSSDQPPNLLLHLQAEYAERRRKACLDLEGPLEPVFYAKHPKSLLVAKKPPALGGIPREIPLDSFCKQEKIIWAGAPRIHQKRRDTLFGQPCQVMLETHTLQSWAQGSDNLLIADMGDVGDTSIGKGVFYVPKNNKSLPAGVCVGVYTGAMSSRAADDHFYPYGFNGGQDKDPSNIFYQHYSTAFFDAQKYRNTTSFFQHGPSEEDLAKINMPAELKSLVATANIIPICGVCTPIPVNCFITVRATLPNEALLFNYGEYWTDMQSRNNGSGSFALFDIQGDIIGTVDLDNQFTLNPAYKPGGKPPAPRCNAESYKIAMDLLERSTRVDREHVTLFLENLRFITNFHAERKKSDGKPFYSKKELEYIERMKKICKQNDAEKVLYRVDDIREEINKPELPTLLPLSLELHIQMSYYMRQRDAMASASRQKTHFVSKLDQEAIKLIYKSLKQSTGNKPWQIDKDQNFCLVGTLDELQPVKKHLDKHSLQPTLEVFEAKNYCLRVKASSLLHKTLDIMAPPKEALIANNGESKPNTK